MAMNLFQIASHSPGLEDFEDMNRLLKKGSHAPGKWSG